MENAGWEAMAEDVAAEKPELVMAKVAGTGTGAVLADRAFRLGGRMQQPLAPRGD